MVSRLFLLLLSGFISAPGADVRALVRSMTLDEKITLLHGARDPEQLGGAGYWPGLPRLGIPPLRFADGPPGVNVNRDATGMPAPVALAATFDAGAARQYGIVLGRDAKSLAQDVLLAPHINLVRNPLFRRNHTTFSEDPFLTARLAAAEIAGIQSQGVMAQAKHLAAYNGSESVEIDERTLHEMYLPAFEAAVKAGVASVMCGYNKLNGSWSCENSELLNTILRGQWGFAGFVTSDWGAVHTPLGITKGTDLEMPGRPMVMSPDSPFYADQLKRAVENGTVPVAVIDEALVRILSQMERFHLLDRKPGRPAIDIEADAKIAQAIAEEGAVLLKNDRGALPLTADDLASLAVIGPTARQLAAGFLGERARGFESRMISPLDALRAAGAHVQFAVGDDLTGVAIDSGVLTAAVDGEYTIMAQAAEGSGSLTIDGRPVIRFREAGKKWSSLLPTLDGRDNARATVHLTAGQHPIQLSSEEPLGARLAWTTPELRRANRAAAVAAAKTARTAVVFAWCEMGENLTLPEEQDELIAAVAAVNPRTIVVLNTGGPVAMPWKDKVRAILEMWYPGQEGGRATANLLLGRANPSGKLPVTFLDHPFGYGLSYTEFEYSDLSVSRTEVAFTLRNAGRRKGAEVAQVYVGSKSLAGFERIELEPGRKKRLTVHLDKHAFSYWSPEAHEWAVGDTDRPIHVGPLCALSATSSRPTCSPCAEQPCR